MGENSSAKSAGAIVDAVVGAGGDSLQVNLESDLEQKVEQMTEDPTAGLQLPPLHNNCRCRVKTLPFLSQPGLKDGRRVWERSEECCGACELSAKAFNEAEVQRLLNKGIDVNRVS